MNKQKPWLLLLLSLAATFLFAASVATLAQVHGSLTFTKDCEGCSIETAVLICATEKAVVKTQEEIWLQEHYPGYYITDGFRGIVRNGRWYDCMQAYFTPSEGANTSKIFYFDVTAFYGKK